MADDPCVLLRSACNALAVVDGRVAAGQDAEVAVIRYLIRRVRAAGVTVAAEGLDNGRSDDQLYGWLVFRLASATERLLDGEPVFEYWCRARADLDHHFPMIPMT